MTSRPILMPKLGLTMTEGVLVEWKVAPGDRVNRGDVLFVVETDKITNEVEAPESGVVETLRVCEGETVPVGEIVAILAGDEETGRAEAPDPSMTRATRVEVERPVLAAVNARWQDAASTPERRARPIATPLARRLAARSGLDVGSVAGSGPRGRIVAKDVIAALESLAPEPTPRAQPRGISAPALDGARGQLRRLGHRQRIAARRLSEAKRDIPHFYIFGEADVTSLLELRAALNANPVGARISMTHFIVTAVARALAAMTELNVVWAGEDAILELRRVDVGIAVETPKGLIAPVLKDIGAKSVEQVAQAATRLVERARADRLTADDLEGGAISVSNVGMFGATGLLPIIDPNQSSILGIGRSQALFRPDDRQRPVLRQVLGLSLSCDHRVIDGAMAARFLQKIQNGLEAPASLLRDPVESP